MQHLPVLTAGLRGIAAHTADIIGASRQRPASPAQEGHHRRQQLGELAKVREQLPWAEWRRGARDTEVEPVAEVEPQPRCQPARWRSEEQALERVQRERSGDKRRSARRTRSRDGPPGEESAYERVQQDEQLSAVRLGEQARQRGRCLLVVLLLQRRWKRRDGGYNGSGSQKPSGGHTHRRR